LSWENFDYSYEGNMDGRELELALHKSLNYLRKTFGHVHGEKCSLEITDPTNWHYSGFDGFFSPTRSEIKLKKVSDANFFDNLLHEVTHYYLESLKDDPPRWLDEGIAQYACFKEGKIIEGKVLKSEVKNLVKAKHNGAIIKLEDLIASKSFEGLETHLAYAESWSLVHFLISTYRFPKYFKRYLKFHKSFFIKEELDILEPRWLCYIDLLK